MTVAEVLGIRWLREQAENCSAQAHECDRRARQWWGWLFPKDRAYWRQSSTCWREQREKWHALADEIEQAAEALGVAEE
jgi:hypothetical protein